MSPRLRRTICVFTSAVMLVGMNGCRHKNCRSQSCQIGSHSESTYDHPVTTYDYYGPGTGPVLSPPGHGLAESELPPRVPEIELAPRPNTGLIQPNLTNPVLPPAPLPSAISPEPTAPNATEPAADDSPFKGAMRSTREKFSQMFGAPHTSPARQPVRRSSRAANSVRPFTSFPRQASVPAERPSPQAIPSQSTPRSMTGQVAAEPPMRHAAQTSWTEKERVQDDFVPPWTNTKEQAVDQESLDLADADDRESEADEIPDWTAVTSRHPVTARPAQGVREVPAPQPIPVGSWVRITPRSEVVAERETTEFSEVLQRIPEPKRLETDTVGPSFVPVVGP
jgi:hypothetical protein